MGTPSGIPAIDNDATLLQTDLVEVLDSTGKTIKMRVLREA